MWSYPLIEYIRLDSSKPSSGVRRRRGEPAHVLREVGAVVLVHDRAELEDLPVHVLRAAVGPGHARAVISMKPCRPAYVSDTSSVCEWNIHLTDDPSCEPGPARSGTSQV
jgi:hypothetical protein